MKRVITYGTFDLFHDGHYKLLQRAKALGDYLIVGVTSASYDKERGKLNVKDSLLERIENVKKTGFADEIVVEEFEGQKILDIQKYEIDIFAIGSDWIGKFDYLKEYCEVVYLERTKGISSTQLRMGGKLPLKLGMVGCGRIAKRFVKESKYVSGVNIESVYNPDIRLAQQFANENELAFATDSLDKLFNNTDAIYIASPHQTHYEYIIKSLNSGKHVLCEKPITLSEENTKMAAMLAKNKGLALMEGIKTAYCPGFEHLVILAKSGRIGRVIDVEASFTKLTKMGLRETSLNSAGGSMYELGSYVCLPIIKLLGKDWQKYIVASTMDSGIDIFSKGFLKFENATASFKVGLGAKTEGDLIITGTKGCIYVPAPWWKTEYFEMRFEDLSKTEKFFYKFEGDGLRYELTEFLNMIKDGKSETQKLTHSESQTICRLIESFKENQM